MANEMRLIDANGSYTLNECNETGHSLCFGGGFVDVYDPKGKHICQFWAGDAPTVDAVPVVHGRWVDNGIPESMLSGCSVCGFSCGAYTFNYCPNCGARMDGGEHESRPD